MGDACRNLLYFAHGEHLCEREMLKAFPAAKMTGTARLTGYCLSFLGRDGKAKAALMEKPGGSVPGRVWVLQERDVNALDRHFGLPHGARREILPIQMDGMSIPALVYVAAQSQPKGRPSFITYDILREAYEDLGEDVAAFHQACTLCAPR